MPYTLELSAGNARKVSAKSAPAKKNGTNNKKLYKTKLSAENRVRTITEREIDNENRLVNRANEPNRPPLRGIRRLKK
jgi:hypothetical protein